MYEAVLVPTVVGYEERPVDRKSRVAVPSGLLHKIEELAKERLPDILRTDSRIENGNLYLYGQAVAAIHQRAGEERDENNLVTIMGNVIDISSIRGGIDRRLIGIEERISGNPVLAMYGFLDGLKRLDEIRAESGSLLEYGHEFKVDPQGRIHLTGGQRKYLKIKKRRVGFGAVGSGFYMGRPEYLQSRRKPKRASPLRMSGGHTAVIVDIDFRQFRMFERSA